MVLRYDNEVWGNFIDIFYFLRPAHSMISGKLHDLHVV